MRRAGSRLGWDRMDVPMYSHHIYRQEQSDRTCLRMYGNDAQRFSPRS
jgi:hypothetical protein